MKMLLSSLAFTAVAAAATLSPGIARAEAIPGLRFQNSYAADAGCLNRHSFGGIRNDCPYTVEVWTSMVLPDGWRSTSVNIFGNNSSCYAVSTGGNANSAGPRGPTRYTLAGDDKWNTLDTGAILVNWNSTMVFTCSLEAGGIIGSAIADN